MTTVSSSELQARPSAGGVRLAVWVKPRASKSRIMGVREGQLQVAVAAPPVGGQANAELLRVLARYLGVARRALRITQGSGGRTKWVQVDGLSCEQVRAKCPAE